LLVPETKNQKDHTQIMEEQTVKEKKRKLLRAFFKNRREE